MFFVGIVVMNRVIRVAVFFLLVLFGIRFAPQLINQIKKSYIPFFTKTTTIGLIKIDGKITDFRWYREQLKDLFTTSRVKAIVLDISSVGGYSGSCNILFDEIIALKKDHPKPIVSFVENVCASGAYYVAAATDQIITSPSAMLGSIGTVIPLLHFEKLLEHVHVGYDTVSTGDYKNSGNPYMSQTVQGRAMLQELCDGAYQQFVGDIARVRSRLPITSKDSWANGRIFIGTQAVKIGLADELGSFSTVEARVKKLVPFEGKIRWVVKRKPTTWFVRLFGNVESLITFIHAFFMRHSSQISS